MIQWRDAHNVGESLSLDDESGLLYGHDNPSLVKIGEEVPVSTLYLRKDPAEVWQKFGAGDLEWQKISGDSSGPPNGPLFLPLILAGGATAHLPLLQYKFPLLLSNGSEALLSLEVA